MQHLSEDIGVRLAGSDNADEAAEYARDQFESWGYDVEMQEFSDTRPESRVFANVHVEQPEPRDLHSIVFLGSQPGSVSGTLVDAGTGLDADFPEAARGAIVLIQRQDVTFNDMAARALAHGALGVIVANNKEGLFRGTIEPAAGLPVVAISQADGDALREQLAVGNIDVSIDVPSSIDGTNVIARPKSGVCRTLSGGHYDTVPWARGAIDNASGAAMVLELARASAAAELPDSCFVLFSAEEEGLLGSAHFVTQMSGGERDTLVAYFNYDVVAGGTQIDVIGDDGLAARAVALGTAAGGDVVLSQLPQGASSDHASFLLANLPAVMMTVDDLGVLHTEQDTFDFARLHTESLQPIANLAFELIQDVLRPATPPLPAVTPP
jgi:aminopeptidase YwaD